jgi:hypothetical protein
MGGHGKISRRAFLRDTVAVPALLISLRLRAAFAEASAVPTAAFSGESWDDGTFWDDGTGWLSTDIVSWPLPCCLTSQCLGDGTGGVADREAAAGRA